MENIVTRYTEETIKCPKCKGTGEITAYSSSTPYATTNPFFITKCNTCKGSGELNKMTIITEIYKKI